MLKEHADLDAAEPRFTSPALPGSPGPQSAVAVDLPAAPERHLRDLLSDVLAGDITLSVRLWNRRVKAGGRYRVGRGEIEVDAVELVRFAEVTDEDVQRAGEPDRETLRRRAAHAGPIDEDTLVYRIGFYVVNRGY